MTDYELNDFLGSITLIDRYSIELCKSCNGIGSYITTDFDEVERRKPCLHCNQDGRVVIHTTGIKGPQEATKRTHYMFTTFVGDPWKNNNRTIRVKIDNRDRWLEKENESLAALNYDHYDKLLEEIKFLKTIKGNT